MKTALSTAGTYPGAGAGLQDNWNTIADLSGGLAKEVG